MGAFIGFHSATIAQTTGSAAAAKARIDSTNKARAATLQALSAERLRVLDSTRTARAEALKIVQAQRAHRTDSLAAIRKYKLSKHYTDSVAKSRTSKLKLQQAKQKAHFDSLKSARKDITDSIMEVRTARLDSVKEVQQEKAKVRAAITAYKLSKRYKDSVNIIHQGRMDSMRVARKEYNDSATAARKAITEATTAARKHVMDSMKTIRTAYMDSLKVIRKQHADSMAVVKKAREAKTKATAKNNEKKQELKLQIKIDKEHAAWSNEKMLTKTWSVKRQIVQNTFTRYNYYFNADRRMDEALENMQRISHDNYDSLLAIFPFDPNRDSTVLAPDMDSIIHKASVAIQIHDPRTKWGDDMYMLLGQANFYKGKYDEAALSFRYIITMKEQLAKYMKKEKDNTPSRKKGVTIAEEDKKGALDFLKHQSVHNEALLWLTRTFTQAGNREMAESVLDLISADPKFPEDLRGRLALERAFLYMNMQQYKTAQEQLTIVSKDENIPSWLRMRSAYLTGQLAQNNKDYNTAADNFKTVVDLHPKIEMDFYARKNLAYSLASAGGEQKDAAASLKSMLKDGKYSPYYDQIYFILGMLSINNKNPQEAITYLRKSIDAPKASKKQKALSFASMGNLYYQEGDYSSAKVAYDSASFLGGSAAGDPAIDVAIRRSQSLDAVTKPMNVIKSQDSLLKLAAMPEKEQRQIAKHYIKLLQQQKADSAFRAENPVLSGADNNSGGGGKTTSYSNWYFSNASLVQQGINDFKRKWGSRKATDNWRRASGAGGGLQPGNDAGAPGNNGNNNDNASAALDENGLPTEASLLAYIPKTPKEKEDAKKAIEAAYRDLADAYVKQLEDYPHAIAAMNMLEEKYPDHGYKPEILYLRYLVALRQNKLDEAQKYSSELQQQFADSKFAQQIKPTASTGASGNEREAGSYYDDTYNMLVDRKYNEVIDRVHSAQKKYNSARYNARFSLLEVSALAGIPDYAKAEKMVTDFITTHPNDSLLKWAESLRQYINANKPKDVPPPPVAAADNKAAATTAAAPGTNAAAGTLPAVNNSSTPVTPAATENATTPQPAGATPAAVTAPSTYQYLPNEEHYVLIIVPKMETKAVAVKAALTDYDNLRHRGEGLSTDITVMKKGVGAIVVKKFSKSSAAKAYANEIKSIQQIFREYKTSDYQLLVISANNYLKLLGDKDIDAYISFYKTKY